MVLMNCEEKDLNYIMCLSWRDLVLHEILKEVIL